MFARNRMLERYLKFNILDLNCFHERNSEPGEAFVRIYNDGKLRPINCRPPASCVYDVVGARGRLWLKPVSKDRLRLLPIRAPCEGCHMQVAPPTFCFCWSEKVHHYLLSTLAALDLRKSYPCLCFTE